MVDVCAGKGVGKRLISLGFLNYIIGFVVCRGRVARDSDRSVCVRERHAPADGFTETLLRSVRRSIILTAFIGTRSNITPLATPVFE